MAKKVQTKRREFMKYSTLGILGTVLAGGVLASPYGVCEEDKLRPPGAVDEKEFWGCVSNAGSVFRSVRITP